MGIFKNIAIQEKVIAEQERQDRLRKQCLMCEHHFNKSACFDCENYHIRWKTGRAAITRELLEKLEKNPSLITVEEAKLLMAETGSQADKANNSEPVKKVCTCSSLDLFNFGCKCGAITPYKPKNWK